MGFIENDTARTILSLAVMLTAGFLVTRVTKRLHLPNVTGYILAGILIGPCVFGLIPADMIGGMGFVTDIALAFIAFGVGKYFKWAQLKKSGWKILILTGCESLAAGILVTLTMIFVFRLSVPFSLLLGAIGSATAPASTIMTIRQYRAKGPFVNLILQVVALDDAVALLAFSACAAVTQAMEGGGASASDVYLPILYNLGALVLGAAAAFLLHWLVDGKRSSDHRLALTIAIILALTGLCSAFNISPLLSCMLLGPVYINAGGNKQLFTQVNKFTPPVLMLFFVLAGLGLHLPSLATAGVIGVVYFFVRILGKYAGAFAGAKICGYAPRIQKCLGLALIPQAGVSIGLAALGQRMLPEEAGLLLSTIILSSGLLYEIVGPACAKASLFLSHTVVRPAAVPTPSGERTGKAEEPSKTGKAGKKAAPPKEALAAKSGKKAALAAK